MMVFHTPVISKLFFSPFQRVADGMYRRADEIVAVSKTYANRALFVSRKCQTGHVVFLGTDLGSFDRNVRENLRVMRKESRWMYDLPECFHMSKCVDSCQRVTLQ